MKKQVVVIHGGTAFEKYDDYLNYLRAKEVTLEGLVSKGWKMRLGDDLGSGYQVISPQMPNAQNARYAEWKIWFEKIIPLLNETVILVLFSGNSIILALKNTGGLPGALAGLFSAIGQVQTQGYASVLPQHPRHACC